MKRELEPTYTDGVTSVSFDGKIGEAKIFIAGHPNEICCDGLAAKNSHQAIRLLREYNQESNYRFGPIRRVK